LRADIIKESINVNTPRSFPMNPEKIRQPVFEYRKPGELRVENHPKAENQLSGRDGQIRTDDILLPKQALYQAELRPVTGREIELASAAAQALSWP
jgi:hypothetical protein